MKVWVIMGNDFPDAVFDSEEAAQRYCTTKMNDPANMRKHGTPRIYWRYYEFKLQS
jgi:hypothetical protein